MHPDLQTALDDTLIDALPRGLANALRDAVRKGARPADMLRRVKATAGRRGPLTVAAVEVFLARGCPAQP